MEKHKAKFFCENCGSEVPQNAKFCGTCGKFFTFVRCPECGYTGDSRKFTTGCPECGYAVNSSGTINLGNSKPEKPKTKSKASRKSRKKLLSLLSQKSQSTQQDSSLPSWIYVIALAALAGVVIGFYSCL